MKCWGTKIMTNNRRSIFISVLLIAMIIFSVSGGSAMVVGDVTAPATTDDAPSGWQNNPFTITLTCDDGIGGSGCSNTYYSIDDSKPLVGNSISISDEGTYAISYYSVDNAGNIETPEKLIDVRLDNTAPVATIIFPEENKYLNKLITINADANDKASKIDYVNFWFVNGGSNVFIGRGIYSDLNGLYSIEWDTTSVADGPYSLWVEAYDNAGNEVISKSVNVIVDNTAPVATIIFPEENKYLNKLITINADANDKASKIDYVNFWFVNGGSNVFIGRGIYSDLNGLYSIEWDTTSVADGPYSLWVEAYDNTGNVFSSNKVNVIVDNTAPVLTEIIPVPVNTNDNTPDYTFNTDEAGLLQFNGACTSIEQEYTAGTQTITFNTLGDDIYLDCALVLTDNAGNSGHLDVSGFTVDTVIPTIVSVSSDGVIYDKDSQPEIRVIFSEYITNIPAITVSPDGGAQTVDDCRDKLSETFCFVYSLPRVDLTTETITVSGAEDLAGNSIIEDSSHTFIVNLIDGSNVQCGDTIKEDLTLEKDIDCRLPGKGATINGLNIGADDIALNCNKHSITGDSGNGIYVAGRSDIMVKNCAISGFDRGIYLKESSNNQILDNYVHNNNGQGTFQHNIDVRLNSDNNTISGNVVRDAKVGINIKYSAENVIYDNTVTGNLYAGIRLSNSDNNQVYSNTIANNTGDLFDTRTAIGGIGNGLDIGSSTGNNIYENTVRYNEIGIFSADSNGNIFENNLAEYNCEGMRLVSSEETIINPTFNSNDDSVMDVCLPPANTGLYVDGNSIAHLTNGVFDNNGAWGIYDNRPMYVYWMIDGNAKCINNNISIDTDGQGIIFDGGVLELVSCTIILDNNPEINLNGNVTSIEQLQTMIDAYNMTEIEAPGADTNITFYLNSSVTSTVTIAGADVDPSGATAGLTYLKGINVEIDTNTEGALEWALIKIYYNQSELDALGIDENTLRIYYFNETLGNWQLEPNQGIDTINDYVWANVTHFSLFGAFGSAPYVAPGGGGGGGGSGGSSIVVPVPAVIVPAISEPVIIPTNTEETKDIDALNSEAISDAGNQITGAVIGTGTKVSLIILLILLILLAIAWVIYRVKTYR